MSSIAHMLEDFGACAAVSENPDNTPVGETELLESFEQGYKAGWDDAIKAKSDNSTNVSDDLAQNLRDLSFTFHEARTAMMADVTAILDDIVSAAIPEILRATMGERLKAELQSLAEAQSGQPATILAHPEDLDVVSSILQDCPDFPTRIEANPALAAGRVEFRIGGTERALDVGETAQEIINAVAGLRDQAITDMPNQENKDVAYG